MIIAKANGKFWCEECDAVAPNGDEGKRIQVGASTVGERALILAKWNMSSRNYNVVEFALCNSCIVELLKKLTEK